MLCPYSLFFPGQSEISHIIVLQQKRAAKLRELLKETIRSEELHGERLLQPAAVVVPSPGTHRNVTVITTATAHFWKVWRDGFFLAKGDKT